MHLQRDRGDVAGLEAMLVAQLDAAVDGRMDDDAAGERLVGVERNLPCLAELLGDLVGVELRRPHVGEAAWRFDTALGTGEVLLSEMRGEKPVLCRPPGMERLAHG